MAWVKLSDTLWDSQQDLLLAKVGGESKRWVGAAQGWGRGWVEGAED